MHSPAPLTVELADEPVWRVLQVILMAVATAVAGFGLGAPALEFATQAAAHHGDGAWPRAGGGGWAQAVLAAALAVGVLVVLVCGWRQALRLLRPEPGWLLVWDGCAWSWAVVAGRDVDAPRIGLASHKDAAPSGWTLEPVKPRISLDLGIWMLLRMERLADGGPASHGMPRVLWRALSRRGAPAVWTPLRAALWAAPETARATAR